MYNKVYEDIKQSYYQDNFSNDGQRFVAWYLRNIHTLNTIEAKDCITDGANDNQIDAVYIDNKDLTIYIVQGKFTSDSVIDAEPLREILSAWTMLKQLEKLQESANYKLKSKINEIAFALDDGYSLCIELITTAKLSKQAECLVDTFSKNLAEDESLPATLQVIDNDILKIKYDDALNSSSYVNHTFILEEGKYLQLDINGTPAILAAIPLKECINIPGIKDGRLFRKNVRQSLGSTNKVNKGIAKTIKKDSGDFFFLHNGITAICSSMKLCDGKLSTRDLNIVNGCQSLTTLFNCG